MTETVSKLEFDLMVKKKDADIANLNEHIEQLSGTAKKEQLRAWAVDRAIEYLKSGKTELKLIEASNMIINYVNGEE